MQFDTASFTGDSVYFRSSNPKMKDTFRGRFERDAIVGELARNGQKRAMTFRKFDLGAHRPQTPIRPFPYVEKKFVLRTPTARLCLAVLLPIQKGKVNILLC
ncbi:hypothetical protein SAMN05421747_11728 [Parapedobacter composti]|uniref:Uncharacterized protein n=1 Tax=Parapedobacter composti TaxID=623281 RepID=A0A1I1KTV2_9SPHI|nr:hypothetical protein SAMN05421747_11728 [Parapedobacter composti]